MDLYISSLLLGALGLGAMALSGLGHQSHGGGNAPGNGGHGHAGHGDGVNAHVGHAMTTGARGAKVGGRGGRESFLWSLMSPRVLFSLALGFGAAGELVRPLFADGVLRAVAALAGAVLFERFLVTPLWNFTMRFASQPALTLESAVADEATAVTAFDANGQGIVSVEVDGQIVQVLATLQPADRSLGVRVRAGQRVRIEDVSASAHRCTVSLI
ncbi:MAG TPA: hypothetical protein VGM82_16465 [Gemmatimonadaceae bacterium]|jgi:hypothetical protein